MALSGIQRTFADILDSIWGKDAQTSIPTQPVSGIAYRDTDAEFESGQKYDSLGESSRWNQMLYLLTGLMSELTAFGILPWSAAQPYSKGALCIGSDGTLWQAQIDIAASPTNPVPPGTDDNVWSRPKIFGFVPDSIRVIAGTGMTGGGPLSGDVTLSAKLDGKTTQADAGGVITVKDVAIGGNLEDLASARGYLVDEYLPEFPSRTVLSSFDDATTPGNFHVLWNDTTTSAPDGILNKNQYADGVLEVRDNRSASFVSSFARLMQRLTIIGGATRADSARIFVRTQSWGVTREWFPWVELVSYNKFGDGFRNTNGIISVPEYEGATASTAGTSGLVPPATASQRENFLTGGGEYKPALTKISDSVSLADSTTAASAKAVKTAYELAADAKQKSNTSGTADYANGLRGIPLQWVGRDASPEFLLGRLGQEPFDAFRPMHIEGVGSAKAWKAQNSGGNYVLYDEILGENPTYIMGYALNGIFKIYTTSALSVNYANNAGQAQLAAPAVQWVVNTSGPAITVPQGGTYNVVCICFNDSGGKGAVKHYPNTAGGTVIPNAPTDYMVAGLCARVA
nr:MAG TPA: hypothetical protein [Caudoviricetes sp.]